MAHCVQTGNSELPQNIFLQDIGNNSRTSHALIFQTLIQTLWACSTSPPPPPPSLFLLEHVAPQDECLGVSSNRLDLESSPTDDFPQELRQCCSELDNLAVLANSILFWCPAWNETFLLVFWLFCFVLFCTRAGTVVF